VKFPRIPLICDFLLKFAGLLTAVALAIATIGIPLHIPFAKEVGELFPCMSCGCGCVNAEVCWRDCCCFSTDQKLAWAREHNVQVPDYLLAQAAEEAQSQFATCSAKADDLSGVKSCCRARVLAARQASCCSKKSGCRESKSPTFMPGVLAIQALKCQGNSLSLSLLPPSVPTDEIGAELELSPTDSVVLSENDFYQPPFFDAVVPPPERAVS
jgi:hypothetical protein